MSNDKGEVTGKGHRVTYRENPNPHPLVPNDTPRTGVPVSPTTSPPRPRSRRCCDEGVWRAARRF